MRVIITGGSGLIGRELTRLLSNTGYEVVILSRSPQKVSGLPANARAEKWDAHTAEGWGHLANGAKAIVNLAGENLGAGLWTAERKKRILDSRVKAGRAVVAAVQAATDKPEVVIQASAVGYYGARGDEILTEEADPQPGYFLSDVCIAWENAVQLIKEMVRLVTVRSAIVLSTQGGPFTKMMLQFKLFAGGPYGNGEHWWPWIHIDDEVAAIKFLLENESARGVYNLVSPDIQKNKAFAKDLGAVLKRPAFMPAPAFALKLVLGEMATTLLDGQRVAPDRLQAEGFQFQFADTRSALKDIVENEK